MDTFYIHSPPPTPLFLKSHSRTGAQSNRLYRLCPLSQGCTLIWDVFIVSSSFFRGICQKIETGLKPHPSKCKGLQRRGQPTVYSALIVRAVLSRPMLTWCARTPKDLTCVRTIRSGTIPLLSQLLDPFRACSPALDQSATASTAASLGNVDRCSSHTLSLPRPPLSPLTSAPGLPPRGPSPSQPSLHPSRCCLSFLPPVATVAAFCLDNRKAYLAVCSARLWQSCQITCSDCRLLCPVSKTQCNYNPRISKWTKWRSVSDQCPGSNTRLPECFIPPGFATGKQSLFKWKRSHYLPLLIELPGEKNK